MPFNESGKIVFFFVTERNEKERIIYLTANDADGGDNTEIRIITKYCR